MSHGSVFRARLQATLACLGGLLLWWRIGGIGGATIAGIAAVFAALAWLAPARYAPVQRGLDLLARGLVAGVSWLLLGLLYFCLFTPLRGWRALARRDTLRLKADPSATTYLQSVPSAVPERFDRQF